MLTARQVSLKFLGQTDGEVGTGWMGEEIIRQLVLLHGTGRWHACTSKLLLVSARPACTMEAPPSVTKREMSSAAPSALIVAQALSALAPPLTGGKPQIDRFADWCPALGLAGGGSPLLTLTSDCKDKPTRLDLVRMFL
ncbi:hypothetical protein C0Q70_11126 [Pomacea canaliculata]|uniref:Uncharacterized protein n=1 Tax=Pomacea canaliculata TaxID=400727 RepID=A0A2T7P549_POMCA|nr:hypothetical protein C0Q70_11126 [Pomacea canaliculata]